MHDARLAIIRGAVMLEDVTNYILGEWQVISGAPASFIVAVLATGGITWWLVTWGYARDMREMSRLRWQLAEYKNKLSEQSPEQAAAEVARLNAEIRSLPRNENSIYERGYQLGTVAGVHIDAGNKLVTFAQMSIQGELDQAMAIEFRDLILAYSGCEALGQQRKGMSVTTTYRNAHFLIINSTSDVGGASNERNHGDG
jgi:hypothetical protein